MNKDDGQGFHLERGFLITLLIVATIAFAWLIFPFLGAIVWGVVAAVLFNPFYERLSGMLRGHSNTATFLTLLVIISLFIIPAISLGSALLQEASGIYSRIQSGEINIGRAFVDFQKGLPLWAQSQLQGFGLADFDGVRGKIDGFVSSSFETLISRLVDAGQSAVSFFLALGIMLYLTYFLLRDGRALAEHIENVVPLKEGQWQLLAAKFVTVVRATIKGSLIVAILQGTIGGIIFWMLGIGGALLWGVSMGFFSLLPAIGTGLVWVPVSIYLIVTGSVWQGIALAACGVLIISMIDNFVRPILVGRDTRMPDYVVLISTFGGLQAFGFNGIVIGPLLAALFIAVWDIFASSNHRAEQNS